MGEILTSVNYVNISDQVKFIDTVKYLQQSLSTLANTMSDKEKKGVRTECENFIKKDPKLNENFFACKEIDREGILNYLSSGKSVISYQMMQHPESLDINSEKDNFFYHIFSILA